MQILTTKAKPFLKWAGGKGQLLEQITSYFPAGLERGAVKCYVEPFVGGGAMFFHIAQQFTIEEFFLADVNEELVLAYTTLQRDVEGLIDALSAMQGRYRSLSLAAQKDMFYEVRSEFNESRSAISFASYNSSWIRRTAQIIFLNRTCFNGLFRVNSKAQYNVPFGRYVNPMICQEENLRGVAGVLQRAQIRYGDFTACAEYVDNTTFVYFDPPYRPISKSASFTSYARQEFNDAEQLRLASFYRQLHNTGAKLMLSNSDPKNKDRNDHFFEEAYRGFRIERVKATRNINSNGQKRGAIAELLIMNY